MCTPINSLLREQFAIVVASQCQTTMRGRIMRGDEIAKLLLSIGCPLFELVEFRVKTQISQLVLQILKNEKK